MNNQLPATALYLPDKPPRSMHESLEARVDGLSGPLEPLRQLALEFEEHGIRFRPSGAIDIAPTPWRGSEAYGISIYPPAPPDFFDAFRDRVGAPIPLWYRETLKMTNGAFVFGVALYGLPRHRYSAPPGVDRSELHPLDLGSANTTWAADFAGTSAAFHFGSRRYSQTENVGYFSFERLFRSMLKDGKFINEWHSFADLLKNELAAEAERARARFTA